MNNYLWILWCNSRWAAVFEPLATNHLQRITFMNVQCVSRISVLCILNWQLSSRRTVAAARALFIGIARSRRHSNVLSERAMLHMKHDTAQRDDTRHDIRYVWLVQSISIRISFFTSHKRCGAESVCARKARLHNYWREKLLRVVDSASDFRQQAPSTHSLSCLRSPFILYLAVVGVAFIRLPSVVCFWWNWGNKHRLHSCNLQHCLVSLSSTSAWCKNRMEIVITDNKLHRQK